MITILIHTISHDPTSKVVFKTVRKVFKIITMSKAIVKETFLDCYQYNGNNMLNCSIKIGRLIGT